MFISQAFALPHLTYIIPIYHLLPCDWPDHWIKSQNSLKPRTGVFNIDIYLDIECAYQLGQTLPRLDIGGPIGGGEVNVRSLLSLRFTKAWQSIGDGATHENTWEEMDIYWLS